MVERASDWVTSVVGFEELIKEREGVIEQRLQTRLFKRKMRILGCGFLLYIPLRMVYGGYEYDCPSYRSFDPHQGCGRNFLFLAGT